jgi:hypothetical protein
MFSYCTAGIPTFRVLSPLMVYSVLLLICLLVVAYFNTIDILLTLLGKNDDFLLFTFNALMLYGVAVSCCVPVLFWLDCPKYVQYLNRWEEFQVTYTSISLMVRSEVIIGYVNVCSYKLSKCLVNYSLMQKICEVG